MIPRGSHSSNEPLLGQFVMFLVRKCCSLFFSCNVISLKHFSYFICISTLFECFHKVTLMWVATSVRELTVPACPTPLAVYLSVFTLLAFLTETSPKSHLSRLGFQTTMLLWQQQEIHVWRRLVVNVRGYRNHCKANIVLNDISLVGRDNVRVKIDRPLVN